MLNFAEQTGSGAVMFVWSFLTCQHSLLYIMYMRFNKIITSYLILLLHQLVSNLHMIVTFYRAMKNNMYYFTTQGPGWLTTGNWLSSRLLSCGRVLSCARKTNACMKNNMLLFHYKVPGWLATGNWLSSRVLPCARVLSCARKTNACMKNNMLLFHYTSTRRFGFGELTFLASSVVWACSVVCA